MNELHSIGYSGYRIDEFVRALVENGVEHLIDTREKPISRKAGFAKTRLSSVLQENGINYTHFRELGSPSSARQNLHTTGNYQSFFSTVRKHLSLDAGKVAIAQVTKIAMTERSCLMCVCEDVAKCHRSQIIRLLSKSGFSFSITEIKRSTDKLAA